MPTVYPTKANIEVPIAKNDIVHQQLINDAILPGSNPNLVNNSLSSSINAVVGPTNPSVSYSASNTNIPSAITTLPQTNLTAPTNQNAANNADVLVANTNSDFINKKWRPLMAFVYMATCITDFILFPILWSVLQALNHGQVTNQWQPLTLQGAGLFHIAMGAVLGVAAYGRTKEKLEDKD